MRDGRSDPDVYNPLTTSSSAISSFSELALTLTIADIISAVEFDKTGEHLATGDRGGRVVLFERLHPSKATLVSTVQDKYSAHVGFFFFFLFVSGAVSKR